jgi:hypothetical protein
MAFYGRRKPAINRVQPHDQRRLLAPYGITEAVSKMTCHSSAPFRRFLCCWKNPFSKRLNHYNQPDIIGQDRNGTGWNINADRCRFERSQKGEIKKSLLVPGWLDDSDYCVGFALILQACPL